MKLSWDRMNGLFFSIVKFSHGDITPFTIEKYMCLFERRSLSKRHHWLWLSWPKPGTRVQRIPSASLKGWRHQRCLWPARAAFPSIVGRSLIRSNVSQTWLLNVSLMWNAGIANGVCQCQPWCHFYISKIQTLSMNTAKKLPTKHQFVHGFMKFSCIFPGWYQVIEWLL